MEVKKYVVYFGIVSIESRNASFQRAVSICRMIRKLGFDPILVGVSSNARKNSAQKRLEDGTICFEIDYPTSLLQWMRSIMSIDDFENILRKIGLSKIKTVIMADYRFYPMLLVNRLCKKNDINFIVDIQDWFILTSIFSLNNWIKILDNFLRLRILYPSIDRKICISTAFSRLYYNTPHLALMPGTIDPDDQKWAENSYIPHEGKITIAFAGKPGKHCEKEKIDWVLKSVHELKKQYGFEIEIIIAGITKEELLKYNRRLKKYAENDGILFLGHIPHNECIKILTESDFTILARKRNKLSQYGFSTKISESFACGTPIIATDTGDISLYIINGSNGYICECTYNGLKEAIKKACQLGSNQLLEMHNYTKQNNSLICTNYLKELSEVI